MPDDLDLHLRRRRRGRAALLGVGAAVLVVAAAFDAVSPDLPAGPVRGSASCDPDRAERVPPDGAVDWSGYLVWQGRSYRAEQAGPPVGLGARLGEVSCTRGGSRTPLDHVPGDGEAAWLPAGTAVHLVEGRAQEAALAALLGGVPTAFELDPAGTAQLRRDRGATGG